MSELKAFEVSGKALFGRTFVREVYHKSDADKVIAHHKYKRCLAMAEWCNSGMVVESFASFKPRRTKQVWREEHKFWTKWRKIWFELAMKFKEVK